MNKKILISVLFVSLFCLTGLVLAEGASIDPTTTAGSFGELLAGIAKAVGQIIAGVGTIAFIISGIMYLTSGGSPQRMQTAKTALAYSIIGMAVGLSASALVDFVKSSVSGS